MSEFGDFSVEDLLPPSPETCARFRDSFNSLPWQTVAVSQSASSRYQNQALNIDATCSVTRRSLLPGAEPIPLIPDASVDFAGTIADEAVVITSDFADDDYARAGDVLRQLPAVIEGTDNPRLQWFRSACEQLSLLKRFPEIEVAPAASGLLAATPVLAENQCLQKRYNNGASLLATRSAIVPWNPIPSLAKGHSLRELRSVTIRMDGRRYSYDNERREELVVNDIVVRKETMTSAERVEAIRAESRFERVNGLGVLTESKLKLLTTIIRNAVESGLAA
jgi:hypothetical protein